MIQLPPPGSRVIIYCRYSTKGQGYVSIEGQKRLCEEYAAKHGWIVVGCYEDAERSGTTTFGRAGLFQMMARAEEGDVQVALFEEIDRASRSAADMHRIAQDLEELDVTLCTVANGVVTDMELGFKAVHNQQFIRQNTFKSKRGQKNAVASGRVSGSIPYGYNKVLLFDAAGEPINGLREIDPIKAAIVRRIYLSFAAGMTSVQIVKELNAEGVPGPRGNPWRPGAILGNKHSRIGILRNPIYIGEVQYGKTQRKRRKGQIKMRFTAVSERLIVQHPELAIIDHELWEPVQARLAEHVDRPFYAKRRMTYLLTGKVACGVCGSPSAVTDGRFACTGRNVQHVCTASRRVPREAVEQTILERMKEHLVTVEMLAPCLAAYREEAERAVTEHADKTTVNEARLKEVNQQIVNLTARLGATQETAFSSQILLQELDRLGAEKHRIGHEIKLRPRPVGPALDAESVVTRIRSGLDDIQRLLEGDDREAVRARGLVGGMIDRVVISPRGEQIDGRGGGDVTVTVEGRLSALIDLADLDVNRVMKDEHRPMLMLDNATFRFSFSYPLAWRDPRLSKVYADLPRIAKLLDEANAPLVAETLAKAFDEGADKDARASKSAHSRALNVVLHLERRGFIRRVKVAHRVAGVVWNHVGLSDEAWRERGLNPPMTQAITPIRFTAPEAVVLVIGQSKPSGETEPYS